MDNITHSLVGWTLGQTGLKRKSRKGLAALILGANAPDIDVFLGWAPWAPLATHRGWTHSFFGGVLVLPLGLAALLWLLDRWQAKRGAVFKSGLEMHFGWLVALSYIGCLTHPLLDWQTSYAIQLFTPFDKHWYHNDSLFIVDVWIILGLGFAIWLSRRREKQGEGNWQRPAIAASAGLLLYITANGALMVGPLPLPGLYAVEVADGKAIASLAFVVTLDPAASDLTRLKPDELTAYFGEDAVRGPGSDAGHKVPLWTWLVVAAALAFFFEGTLLRKP